MRQVYRVTAQHRDWCLKCSKAIQPGESIVSGGGSVWEHTKCFMDAHRSGPKGAKPNVAACRLQSACLSGAFGDTSTWTYCAGTAAVVRFRMRTKL